MKLFGLHGLSKGVLITLLMALLCCGDDASPSAAIFLDGSLAKPDSSSPPVIDSSTTKDNPLLSASACVFPVKGFQSCQAPLDCDPTTASCTIPTCPAGQFCIDDGCGFRFCVPPITPCSATDCQNGNQCQNRYHCPEGFGCESDEMNVKRCVDRRMTCTDKNDCPVGFNCAVPKGSGIQACVRQNTGCTGSEECPTGYTCQKGFGEDNLTLVCVPPTACGFNLAAACVNPNVCADLHNDGLRECIPSRTCAEDDESCCQSDAECLPRKLCFDKDNIGIVSCQSGSVVPTQIMQPP